MIWAGAQGISRGSRRHVMGQQASGRSPVSLASPTSNAGFTHQRCWRGATLLLAPRIYIEHSTPSKLGVFSHIKQLVNNYKFTCYLYQSISCGAIGLYCIRLYFSAFDTHPDDYPIT